jgi:hypothetical protein
MATVDHQAAANAAVLASDEAFADLNKQIVELTAYQDSVNTTINIPVMVAAPNTDIYYLYSQNSVVNVAFSNGGIVFPTGTTAQRPVNPVGGTVRYNSNSSSLEIYTNKWQDVGTGAAGGAGGGAVSGVFYENSNTITESFTSTPGKQIFSAGPITLSDPLVRVTIANGSVWTVN